MHLQPLFVFTAVSFLLLAESVPALAQSASGETVPSSTYDAGETQVPITEVLFKPSDTGPPPDTRGAGSRSDRLCPQDAPTHLDSLGAPPLALTALVPDNHEGLTWAERPTIWIYLPETSARQMVLSLRAEGSQPHSQQFLPIAGSGIVGIPLDESAPPLEVGQSYQWAVVLVCGDRPSPNDPAVTAWVRRVAPSGEPPQDALERAVWYGERGVWYDTLTAVVEVRRLQTTPAFTDIWINFLTQPSVELGAIANEPVR